MRDPLHPRRIRHRARDRAVGRVRGATLADIQAHTSGVFGVNLCRVGGVADGRTRCRGGVLAKEVGGVALGGGGVGALDVDPLDGGVVVPVCLVGVAFPGGRSSTCNRTRPLSANSTRV